MVNCTYLSSAPSVAPVPLQCSEMWPCAATGYRNTSMRTPPKLTLKWLSAEQLPAVTTHAHSLEYR